MFRRAHQPPVETALTGVISSRLTLAEGRAKLTPRYRLRNWLRCNWRNRWRRQETDFRRRSPC